MSYKNMKYTEYFQIYNDLCDKHRKEVENLTSEIRIDVADILYRLGTEFVELDFDFTYEDGTAMHCDGIEVDYDDADFEFSDGVRVHITYDDLSEFNRGKVTITENLEEYSVDLHIRILCILERLLLKK